MSTYASRRGETLPWWLVLVEGVIAAVLGLALLVAPGAALFFMVQVLGLYLFIVGIFRIIGIFIDASWWGLKLLAGVLSILAGLFVLEHPLWSTVMVPSVLVFVVGFLSIFQGAAGLVIAGSGYWHVFNKEGLYAIPSERLMLVQYQHCPWYQTRGIEPSVDF